VAGERDGKARKKTDKNQLLAIIDGKETARDRMIAIPGRSVGRGKREATADPADDGIVFQYVNTSRIGRSRRIVTVARNKVIHAHKGGDGPVGRQRVRAHGSVGRDDQGDRLAGVRRRAKDRELAVLCRRRDALAGIGRTIDRRRQRIAGVAARQGGRIRDIGKDPGSDGSLLAIRAAVDGKGKSAGNRIIELVDLGKGDFTAGLGGIDTLTGGKGSPAGRVDTAISRQRGRLRAQGMDPKRGVGEGNRDFLAVSADTGDIQHALEKGGAFTGFGRRPWCSIDHSREIGRHIGGFDACLFFAGGKDPTAKKQDQKDCALIHVHICAAYRRFKDLYGSTEGARHKKYWRDCRNLRLNPW
jgi:hypothetical protein